MKVLNDYIEKHHDQIEKFTYKHQNLVFGTMAIGIIIFYILTLPIWVIGGWWDQNPPARIWWIENRSRIFRRHA